MELHTIIINDPQKFAEIEDELTLFVEEHSQNPFSLPPFLKNGMLGALKQNHVPLVIIFRNEKEIVGLAPLELTRKFGVNTAKFLLAFWTSIDFVIKNEYRQSVATNVTDVLFKRLHCKFVALDFPEGSPNMNIFEQSCKRFGVLIKKKSEDFMGHGIVFPGASLKNRRLLKRELRATERRLANAGSTKITLEEDSRSHEHDDLVYYKLMAIEKNSWKQTYRSASGQESGDNGLCWLLNSTNYLNRNRFLKRKTWFLELDGKPIAFQLVIEYKRTAYFCKTSFVDKYKKLGIGIYLINSVIKETFGKDMERIDFLTSLPFMKKWRAELVPRVHFSAGSRVIFGLQRLIANLGLTYFMLQGRKKKMFHSDTARVQLEQAQHMSIIRRVLEKLPL